MLVNDIDPIRKKIVVKIHNYDKHVNFSALKIRQQLLSHAEFEFFWRISDKITTEPLEDFESFKKFFGAEVMFSFFNFVTQKEMLFKGLIDNMEIRNQDGASAGFLVKGHSHTIAMEDLKYSRMHLGRTLQEIVAESLKGQAVGMWEIEDIAPANNQIIASSLQSNEHGWKYICRLARNFGEWLYWDGTRLQFGRLKDSKMVLVNGIHLKSFGMGSRLVSNKSSYSGYDYEAGALIEGQLEKTDDNFNDSLMNTSLNAQKLQFIRKMDREIPFHSYSSNAQHQSDIDQMNKLDAAGKAAMMVTYSVESHVPVCVGHIVTIKNKTVDHVMIVTKSEITSIGVGNLVCRFEAIPADAKHPPYTNSEKHGKAKAQPAVVLDNNDPAGMGRVKVKYFWGKSDNESDWLRVQTVHGGSGKGFYFIPEIGEEVRVSFEGGNPDRGFVSGSNFNGKEISEYADSGNNLKAIHTRSGIETLFNDEEGSWKQSTPDGNFLYFDGHGNATLNIPKNFNINVGQNFNINVGQNVSFLVGLKAIYNIGVQMIMSAPVLKYFIADNYHLQSPKTLINGDGEIKIEAKQTNVAGTQKLFMHSEENATMNSKGVVHVKGQDGTSHTNVAETFTPTDILLDAKCIVQFRPQSNWKGEFGFDWFRIGDTGLDGDTKYDTLIGQYYTKAITDSTTTRNNNVNLWTAFFQVDPQPIAFTSYNKVEALKNLYGNYQYSLESDASGNPIRKRYYRPFITLFPRTPDPANPRKFLEKGEAELELYLEFQKVDGKEVKPDRVIFEVDGRLADNSHPLISIDEHTLQKGDLIKKIDIKLTCNATFYTDKDINVFTVMLDEKGNEKSRQSAGVLRMIAPSKQLQKDVVIIKIRTRFGDRGDSGLAEFKRNLGQALIFPNIVEKARNSSGGMEDVVLDVRNSANNHLNINFNTEFGVTSGNIVKEEGSTINLDDYLRAELERKYPGQFTNHFKLFFLKETNDLVVTELPDGNRSQTSTAGYSRRNTDFGIMFGNHDASTIGHECLHGLGLPHSFVGNEYIYKALKTDNVMDYSHLEKDAVNNQSSTKLDRVSTWYWQWRKVNTNIN